MRNMHNMKHFQIKAAKKQDTSPIVNCNILFLTYHERNSKAQGKNSKVGVMKDKISRHIM